MASSLDHIRVFVAVVDRGSFRGAARALGLSPSAVSKRVSALERHLEAQLLQRTTRRLALTLAGEQFYDEVREIPGNLAAAEERLREATGRVAGVLRVVMPGWFETAELTDRVIPSYLARNPGVELDLDVVPDPIQRLGGTFDLLIAGRLPDQRFPDSAAVSRRIARLRGALLATPTYLATHGLPTSPWDLSRHNCLSYRNPSWHFSPPGAAPWVFQARGNLRTNSNQGLRAATLAGQGIAYAFPSFFADDLAQGRVVELLPDHTAASFIEVHGFTPPTRFLPLRTRAFLDLLQATFSGADGGR